MSAASRRVRVEVSSTSTTVTGPNGGADARTTVRAEARSGDHHEVHEETYEGSGVTVNVVSVSSTSSEGRATITVTHHRPR